MGIVITGVLLVLRKTDKSSDGSFSLYLKEENRDLPFLSPKEAIKI